MNIHGFGDNLTIDDVCIGDLSPKEHEKIELSKGGKNYKPLENVVVSHVKDSSTLICRKPSKDEIKPYIEEELLDGLCCYSAVNQGQLNKKIVDAVVKHLTEEKLPTVPRSIRHKYMSAFLLATTGITKMDRVIPKVAGVEAPELMFKLARRWGYEIKGIPNNQAIIVVANGNFHGRSLAAISMSNDPEAKNNFGPFVPGIERIPFNDIDALEAIFQKKSDNIAAFLVEPIQGEAGVIVPKDDYWKKVKKLCEKHNILLAMDEVQTGFGRTGENFAHQLYNVKPDMISCGKAAGGGILPVSFVAGSNEVMEVLTPGSEGSTFGGYPLGTIVGIYAIKVLIDDKLAHNAKIRGAQLMDHLNNIKNEFPNKIKEVRGKGLLTAFEMHDSPNLNGHKVSVELLKKGIYVKETHVNIVRIAPALTIAPWQIDNLAESIRNVINML